MAIINQKLCNSKMRSALRRRSLMSTKYRPRPQQPKPPLPRPLGSNIFDMLFALGMPMFLGVVSGQVEVFEVDAVGLDAIILIGIFLLFVGSLCGRSVGKAEGRRAEE